MLRGWEKHPEATIRAGGFDLHFLEMPMPAEAPGPRYEQRRGEDERVAARAIWPQKWTSSPFGRLSALRWLELGVRRLADVDRSRRSGYCHVAEGYGGVLIRPEWLPPEAWGMPALHWAVDDVWLSGHLEWTGHAPWLESGAMRLDADDARDVDPFYLANIGGANRRQANVACAQYLIATWGIWT